MTDIEGCLATPSSERDRDARLDSRADGSIGDSGRKSSYSVGVDAVERRTSLAPRPAG